MPSCATRNGTSSSSCQNRESSPIVTLSRPAADETDPLHALRRLAAIVSGSQDAILAKDLDGVITDWNPAAERLFGLTADQAIGRPVSIIIPPERADEERAIMRRVLAGEPVQHILTERLRPDGTRVQVALTASPIHGEDGRPVGVSTTARDVTEQLRADEERARLAAVVRSTSDAVVAMDLQGRVTDFNGAAAAMFGLTRDDIGAPVLDAIGAEQSERARREEILRRTTAGETLHYEAPRIDAAGNRFILASTIGPTHDAEGRITGIAAIGRDVTAQRRAQEQQSWLAAIVESSRDAIIGFSLAGDILSWNPAAARMFGWTEEEAIGRAGGDMFVKEGRRRRHIELMRGIAAGEGFEDEPELGLRRDGTTFDATVTGFPIRDPSGEVQAAAFVVRDVTDQRRLEEQLEQARRMEAVGRLAGGVAHDFNNLLTVITGYTGVLRGSGTTVELEEIDRAARRATELTGQLLAFSRQRTSNPVLLDLGSVLRGIVPMLERLIGEHIRIVVHDGGRLAPVMADVGQMEQVIINLATNGRDAMPDGGTLTMETRMVDLDGPHVCLAVSDTGAGIDPAIADHVFEPFYTTKEPGHGTGLGLATAHGIVTQAGGRIHAYSEPGLGATFRVYLPAVVGEAAAPPQTPSEPEEVQGTETILLCEDEGALRFMIARILSDAGYEVLAAPGGAEALELAAARDAPVDALVTDVIMPGLSGPELATRLTAGGVSRTLFLSGYTADILADRENLPPGSAFLEKPFAPSALLSTLRALLDGD
jgi:two-component system, cell cycle sensor histidine kinase and response regulator CckA